MDSHGTTTTPTGDDGFGMAEIIVSMFILGLLAIAFLPILILGLQHSASNSTLATATQLVNDRLELARSQATCAGVGAANQTVTDPRGIALDVTSVAGACPISGYPTTIELSVSVTRTDTGDVVAAADTLVYVEEP